MKAPLTIVLILLCFVFACIAHSHSAPCNHEEKMENWFASSPGLREDILSWREKKQTEAEKFLQGHRKQVSQIRIPVVWHVFHNQNVPQVSQTQIQTEMTLLNQWFTATNTYYNDRSSYWQNDIAGADDLRMEFVLASVDPSGNPTNGIYYYQSDLASTCHDENMFISANGGVDAWNTLQYLNIWVCDLQGWAGYAYYPGSGTHYRDGMVLDFESIGDTYFQGSTPAHEIGHWLGLPHTFAPRDNSGNYQCISNYDAVADTPDSDRPGFDYLSWNACRPGQNGLTDSDFMQCGQILMIQNVMDYNYEECKSYFSKGQAAVMRSWVDGTGIRGGLKNSPGLGNSQSSPPPGASSSSSPVPSPSRTQTRTPSRTRAPGGGGLSDVQQFILDTVNSVRSEVNPPAINPLTTLSYSTSLEAEAQSYANACNFNNPSSYGRTRVYYGGIVPNTISYWESALNLWISGSSGFVLNENGLTCSDSCLSYSQMIWDHPSYPTTEIGCAKSDCSGQSNFMCFYNGKGNWISNGVPLLPYEPCLSADCGGAPGGCQSNCQEGDCGEIQTDCGTIFCGCCDEPCLSHSCGEHLNECSETVNCGACDAGFSCTVGSSGFNECVQDPPPCTHPEECSNNGFTCGDHTFCGITLSCGTCTPGQQICSSNFECVPDPCAGCPPNSLCDDNQQCVCLSGFIDDGAGNCILPDASNLNPLSDFEQRIPSSGTFNFAVTEDSRLELSQSGQHVVQWISASNFVDQYSTTVTADVYAQSGNFAIGTRFITSGSRSNDRIEYVIKNIGTSQSSVTLDLVYYGGSNQFYETTIPSISQGDTVSMFMGFDPNANNIITRITINGVNPLGFNVLIPVSYYPSLGGVSFSLTAPGSFGRTSIATSSSLSITLAGCIDDSEWEALFYTLTGANPATTQVTVRENGENGNCGGKSAGGKELVSGFITVITSSGVPAAALASKLSASVGTPAGAILGLSGASVIPGATGAALAGLPAAGATGAAVSIAGAGAGAGGAAASSGLSGGAIAGIVVGSVAGGLLLLGVAGLVVAAVVVAAVVIASGGDEDDTTQQDDGKRKSVRKTIRGFFGGVDVMNNPEKGHQSITARSPAV